MLNLPAYMGVWYEIGRKNAPFEAQCYRSIAEYQLNKNGTVNVTNYCLNNMGNVASKITGVATPVSNTELSIVFEGGQRGIYSILWTDYDHYSFVGDVNTGYLSILSRHIEQSSGEISLLNKLAEMYGFYNVTFKFIPKQCA